MFSCDISKAFSVDQKLLEVLRSKGSLKVDQTFSVAGPSLWNDLLLNVRQAPALSIFKIRLKTHLYCVAYWPTMRLKLFNCFLESTVYELLPLISLLNLLFSSINKIVLYCISCGIYTHALLSMALWSWKIKQGDTAEKNITMYFISAKVVVIFCLPIQNTPPLNLIDYR